MTAPQARNSLNTLRILAHFPESALAGAGARLSPAQLVPIPLTGELPPDARGGVAAFTVVGWPAIGTRKDSEKGSPNVRGSVHLGPQGSGASRTAPKPARKQGGARWR